DLQLPRTPRRSRPEWAPVSHVVGYRGPARRLCQRRPALFRAPRRNVRGCPLGWDSVGPCSGSIWNETALLLGSGRRIVVRERAQGVVGRGRTGAAETTGTSRVHAP